MSEYVVTTSDTSETFSQYLSPPVHVARWALMHRFLSVCPSLDNNSYLGKYYSYESETLPQYKAFIGAYRKNTYYTLGSIFLVGE